MPYPNNLTRENVERELDRFVDLGRAEYLRQNDIQRRRGRTRFIRWRGTNCDMKAVGYIAGNRPRKNPISDAVARRMVALGFTIVDAEGTPRSNPP